MTPDILQSDLDLARKLLHAGRPATQIITALRHRGIDSERAARLVADLQSGKPVEPDKPIKISLSPAPSPPASQQSDVKSSRPPDSSAKRAARSRPRRTEPVSHWFTVIALVSATVCVAAFVFLSRRSHPSASLAPTHIPGGQSAARPSLDPKSITIQIETNGLQLCGNAISRENFLGSIFKILGAPPRTNHVQKVNQTIYVYDAFGVLVYSTGDSGDQSIVLDFEGSDGVAGTKSAFVGSLKLDDQVVRANTDAISLSQIRELGLETPTSASGIFSAQFGGLKLVFGYLKTPERLNLVEIDFK
jgi:hypothetical protein